MLDETDQALIEDSTASDESEIPNQDQTTLTDTIPTDDQTNEEVEQVPETKDEPEATPKLEQQTGPEVDSPFEEPIVE